MMMSGGPLPRCKNPRDAVDLQQQSSYILYIELWLHQDDKKKDQKKRRREVEKEREERARAKAEEKSKQAADKKCDQVVSKLSPSFVALEVLHNDRRIDQVPRSFKEPFDQLFSKLTRYLKEAETAREASNPELLTIDASGCPALVQEAKKLEQVVKSVFSSLARMSG